MRKIGLKSIGILAVTAFSMALTSCGGSSGGGDSEIGFEVKDLVNKYWYYNGFVNASYEASGVLLVYKFQGNNYDTNGVLVKQQFSGRKDNVNAGTWELLDDKLTIVDNTIAGSSPQYWYLRKDASGSILKLRGAGDLGGDRDFHSEVSGLKDITADAFYSKVRNSDGSIKTYIGYEVVGNYLKEVVAMAYKNDINKLVKSYEIVTIDGVEKERVVLKLDPEEEIDYLDEVNGENEIRFSMELEDGTELMLNESLSSVEIDALDYVRGYTPDTHVVSWNANLGAGVFYRVEVLDGNGKVVFRSLRQSDNSDGVLSLLEVRSVINKLSLLKTEDPIFVRITGFKYEEGVDPDSFFSDSNIQAKAMYTYKDIW
jgi:hypothetical protein